jgi:hypothetical protein
MVLVECNVRPLPQQRHCRSEVGRLEAALQQHMQVIGHEHVRQMRKATLVAGVLNLK